MTRTAHRASATCIFYICVLMYSCNTFSMHHSLWPTHSLYWEWTQKELLQWSNNIFERQQTNGRKITIFQMHVPCRWNQYVDFGFERLLNIRVLIKQRTIISNNNDKIDWKSLHSHRELCVHSKILIILLSHTHTCLCAFLLFSS